jgi:ABC-type branched-subunit amino acid transport system ATPase component
LLDEPTEGIQPSIIEEIAETLHALRKRYPFAMLLVEQKLSFIQALSDRILILQKGMITGEIPPEAVGDADVIAEFSGMS